MTIGLCSITNQESTSNAQWQLPKVSNRCGWFTTVFHRKTIQKWMFCHLKLRVPRVMMFTSSPIPTQSHGPSHLPCCRVATRMQYHAGTQSVHVWKIITTYLLNSQCHVTYDVTSCHGKSKTASFVYVTPCHFALYIYIPKCQEASCHVISYHET